jgi:N-carbamoylputrescine amidase
LKDITVALACTHSIPHDIEGNLNRMERFLRKAGNNTDILCFPELSMCGYSLNQPSQIYSPSLFNEIIDKMADLSSKYDLIILAGMIEASEKGPYISHIVSGPSGIIGIYRKSHLSPQEQQIYRAGDKIDIFRLDDLVFGIQLCYEAHFPEISTIMALKGADMIFIPHASPRGDPEQKTESWLRHLTARAFDNGTYILACNQVGQTDEGFSFPGVAVIIHPSGNVIENYAGEEERMIVADLKGKDLEEIRRHRMKYFLPYRRPELYREIIKS